MRKVLPGVLVSLGMRHRTKWGWVLFKLVISLFKFSYKTVWRGLEQLTAIEFIFLLSHSNELSQPMVTKGTILYVWKVDFWKIPVYTEIVHFSCFFSNPDNQKDVVLRL